MNMLFHHLLILLACIVSSFASSSTTCPTKCRCDDDSVYCMYQKITNKDLLDIASQSDTKKTVHLDLSWNLITDFRAELFVNFTKLDEITLYKNQLTRLPANISLYIPSVTVLDLEDNNINKIKQKDFEGYDSIKAIFLERNGIENLEPHVFQNLSQLKYLYAGGNKLTTLRKGTFTGLAKLQRLYLTGNDITTVETGVFGDLPSLRWIFLRNNKITKTQRDWFGSVAPTILKLEYNPLICDCVMYDTINYIGEFYGHGRVFGKCNGIELRDFYRNNKLNCSSCSVNECQNDATCQVVDQFNYNCSCSQNNHGEFCQFKNAYSGYHGQQRQLSTPKKLSTPDTGFIILMVVLAILVLIGLVGLAIFLRRRRGHTDYGEEVNMSLNR